MSVMHWASFEPATAQSQMRNQNKRASVALSFKKEEAFHIMRIIYIKPYFTQTDT